jgi:hypothetical protein
MVPVAYHPLLRLAEGFLQLLRFLQEASFPTLVALLDL